MFLISPMLKFLLNSFWFRKNPTWFGFKWDGLLEVFHHSSVRNLWQIKTPCWVLQLSGCGLLVLVLKGCNEEQICPTTGTCYLDTLLPTVTNVCSMLGQGSEDIFRIWVMGMTTLNSWVHRTFRCKFAQTQISGRGCFKLLCWCFCPWIFSISKKLTSRHKFCWSLSHAAFISPDL